MAATGQERPPSPPFLQARQPTDSFREILRSVSDFLMVVGHDWTILYANYSELTWDIASFLHLSSVETLVGRDYWQTLPMYQGTDAEVNLRAAMEHGEKRTWENQGPITDQWYRCFAYPCAEGLTLFAVDITEHRRNEEALRRREEHHGFLLRLSDALSPLSDVVQIENTATHLLKEHLGVSRVSFTKCNPETHSVHIYVEDPDAPAPSLLGCYPYEDFPVYVAELSRGQPLVIPDMQTTPILSPRERERFLQMGVHAQVTVPLIKGGKLVACHAARQHTPRQWRADEVDLVRESAERTWAAIDHLTAQEALRQSEAHAQVLARELESRNQLITDFFINISHEFKTPLSILLLGISLLERKAARLKNGAADILKSAAVMRQNAFRLSRLVNNLLDITKLDAGFLEPTWERCDIVQRIASLVSSTEFYARQRGLTLRFACNVRQMDMTTDSFLVDRILLNLLSNAIKHTPAGGHIEVVCHAAQEAVRIEVRDDGEGIPPEKHSLIFERFRQVDTAMTRFSEGSGVGLALTRAMVGLLGGTIQVQSAPGQGSTFTVQLVQLDRTTTEGVPRPLGMELKQRIEVELSDIL